MTILGILLGVLVVILITAATGYFVAQEFSYMAVDRSRLKARAEAGDAAAARALTVTRRTSFMLSGAQLGITVTGLLVGYVAEPLIGNGIREIFGSVGAPVVVGVIFGIVASLGLSTVVQMVLGELFPKNLAIARPEPVARALALSTTVYLKIFGPIIRIFDAASNALLRTLNIEPVHDVEHSATPRDLEHIVAESGEVGEIPPELTVLLDRILDFPTRSAEHAMVPRIQVDHVAADLPLRELTALMAVGHTRYPVIDGAADDDIRGVVRLHDVLDWSARGDVDADSATAAELARPAVIVPTTLPLPEVLSRIEENDDEMAVVIDEYGGFAGMITAEDIAEELVGEIDDEHDEESSVPITEIDVSDSGAAAGWLIRGDTHLDEVSRAIGHDLPEGDYDTISGLVITTLGDLPEVDQVVDLPVDPDPGVFAEESDAQPPLVQATVIEIDKRVPSLLRVTLTQPEDIDEVDDVDEAGEEQR